LAGDEEPPAVDGFVAGREENFSQQIKADPEDGLSAAFVGLEEDRPVFRLPLAGPVGERRAKAVFGSVLVVTTSRSPLGSVRARAKLDSDLSFLLR